MTTSVSVCEEHLVVNAVSFAPVYALPFPVLRQITGKIAESPPTDETAGGNCFANPGVRADFPEARFREMSEHEQGNAAFKQRRVSGITGLRRAASRRARYQGQLDTFGDLLRGAALGSSRIPGAPASQFLARIGHDQPTWPLAGLGGYIETVFHDDFFIDDTNLKAPVYAIASGG